MKFPQILNNVALFTLIKKSLSVVIVNVKVLFICLFFKMFLNLSRRVTKPKEVGCELQ
jgi:hypothetical protein